MRMSARARLALLLVGCALGACSPSVESAAADAPDAARGEPTQQLSSGDDCSGNEEEVLEEEEEEEATGHHLELN